MARRVPYDRGCHGRGGAACGAARQSACARTGERPAGAATVALCAASPVFPGVARRCRFVHYRDWRSCLGAMLQVEISNLQNSIQVASDRAARFDRVVNVLASDKLSVKPLQPAVAPPSSSGYVFLDPNSGTGMLMCHDLPPVEQGHAYQVWFVRGNDRISAGMLWPDRSGDGYTMIQVPADLQSFDSIGLTDEPGPTGSPWPTTARVMGAPLR